jgi:hypothetical protein
LDEEKSKYVWLGLAKWFWPTIFAQFAQASKMNNKVACAPAEKM